MTLRFFSSSLPGNPLPPPMTTNFDFNTMSVDAGAADRMKRNARRIFKKKRTTVTLTILLLVSQCPVVDDEEVTPSAKDNNDDNYNDTTTRSSEEIERENVLNFYHAMMRSGSASNVLSFSGSHDVVLNDQASSPITPTSSFVNNNHTTNASSSVSSPKGGGAPSSSLTGTKDGAVGTSIVVGSPVAATRYIRSTTGGEPKISMFCTVAMEATPDDVIAQIEAELRKFHHRHFLHPLDFYVLHPAFEGQGALDRSRRPLHGSLAPLLDGLGGFPFPPLALVPSVFAADRLQIEAKEEPRRRMVTYHERLLMAQHLGGMSQLLREVANLAAGTATQQWIEWRQLKNSEIDRRTEIDWRALARQEAAGRAAIAAEERDRFHALDTFGTDIQSFFDDCVFFFRRNQAAFEATRVIMGRARTECVQQEKCRERWEALVAFCQNLWMEAQRTTRNFFIQSRLVLEISTVAEGEMPEKEVKIGKTSLMIGVGEDDDDDDGDEGGEKNESDKDEDVNHQNRAAATSPSSVLRNKKRAETRLHHPSSLLATTGGDSRLGATRHAVEVRRSRRLLRMAQEQDALLREMESGGAASSSSSSSSSGQQLVGIFAPSKRRSQLCDPDVLCGDPFMSTMSKTTRARE